ncbi:unknown [Clostridium sp. CAG:306]|nr:unknown [Clostridium sp. CAG:306]
MVSAVGSIGSYAASIFQYQGLQSTSNVTTDSTAISFDDMVSNGMIDVSSDDSSSTGVTAMGGGSGGAWAAALAEVQVHHPVLRAKWI